MKDRVIIFLAIFFGAVMCSVIIAFCGGVEFGTGEFGWIVATGMMIGGVAGSAVASTPHIFR